MLYLLSAAEIRMFRGWKHSYKYIPMWEAMDL